MKNSNKHDDILQAALKLIAEYGFRKAPISVIAKKADVGSGTIYVYFETKDALIKEINKMLEKNIIMVIKKNYPSNKDIKERYFYLCETILKYFINNPIHFRFIEQYFNSPYGVSLHRERILGENEKLGMFRVLIEEGIKKKVIKDLPVFMHFALAFGPLIILARNYVLGLIEFDDVQINQVIETFWVGIKR